MKDVKVGDKVRLTEWGRANFVENVGRSPTDDESVGTVAGEYIFVHVALKTPAETSDGLWRFNAHEIEVIDADGQ
jgi:hypothetical protein